MKLFISVALMMIAFCVSGFAQDDMKNQPKPTEKDKTEAIPTQGFLKRGAPIGTAEKADLAKILESPAAFAGKKVLVEGLVVRSCKTEGCWAELAPAKDGKSVRVTMKDHSFFIPLQSAGAFARAEGVFVVKTLDKDHVEHMIKEDGAKFPNRNADGTVTEVSFEATGIELTRKS